MRRFISRSAHSSVYAYSAVFLSGQGRRAVCCGVLFVMSLLVMAKLTGTASVSPVSRRIGQSAGAAVGESNQAQNEPVVALEPGKPIERELAGPESHTYRVTLAAGQFLRGVIDQRGVNLIITLSGPDGRKIADLDSPVGSMGPEPISLIAENAGYYLIVVRAKLNTAPKGRYEARIDEVRPAGPQDRIRVAAERAFAEATLIAGLGSPENQRKAIAKYVETIRQWQVLGDRRQEAHTLTVIGYFHRSLGETQQALEYYNRALPLSQAAGDSDGEAMTLYHLGSVYHILGENRKALDFYNKSLAIFRTVGNLSMEAAALGNTGTVHSDFGEYQKALDSFTRSLEVKRKVGDLWGQATLLNNLGLVQSYMGEKQKALEYFDLAIPIQQKIGDRWGEATTLNNIGSVYADMGDHEKALDFYQRVVDLKRESGNRLEEAIALNNVGTVHGKSGRRQKALELYNQALQLSRSGRFRSSEAVTLVNIGNIYLESGDPRKSLDFFDEALAIQRDAGEPRGESITLTHIGRAHHSLGEHRKALDFFNLALTLKRSIADRGGEALTLYNVARVHRDLDQLEEARARIESSLAIIETLRTKVASKGLRTSYLASTQKYYEFGIDLLMRMARKHPSEGFAAAALQLSERARARTLLELLTEAGADIRRGVPAALLERERGLQQSLDARAAAQTRLLAGKHSPEQAAAAAKEINDLTTEYEQVQAQIRSNSPRYAALTQPTPLSLREIQAEVLDPNTLLLEYALGEDKSYLWVVAQNSFHGYELPGRLEIETTARRVYELLTARNLLIPKETPEQRRRRLESVDAEYPKASAALSRMLLGPAASQLGSKRLMIVSEGMLQYAPFAALPAPESGSEGPRRSERKSSPPSPLIVEHEIVTLPSASVLAALRRETARRRVAEKTVAVLADPVFDNSDARLGPMSQVRSPGVKEPPAVDVRRVAAESGLPEFVRLRFTRQEAEQIIQFAPEGEGFKALDFAANRDAVMSAELGRYRIVHFATHGLIDSQHPELSGIVLSLVDEHGRPQNGFLRLYDIYNLKLGADLVVLSGCQTALGKEVKGEGLIGLTRGFMYAGAPRVAASLWRIDDRTTAEFMKRFYQRMLGERMTPAAALRAAQLSMWRERRWEPPHNWAAFTLQGEWK